MEQWEYMSFCTSLFETNSPAILKRLNKLGKEGWELVAIYKGTYYLKRRC